MRLLKSILTVGGWTFISRIAGFVRDMLIARFLGAGLLSDAFFVSLRFPNLFRSLFAEGSLNVSFLPIFSGLLHSEGKERARKFAREAFSFMFYLLLVLTVIIELCMPWLIFVLVPGFDNDPGKLVSSMRFFGFPFCLHFKCIGEICGGGVYADLDEPGDDFLFGGASPVFSESGLCLGMGGICRRNFGIALSGFLRL